MEESGEMTGGATVLTQIYELRWQWWHRRALGEDGDVEFLDCLYALMDAERNQHLTRVINLSD